MDPKKKELPALKCSRQIRNLENCTSKETQYTSGTPRTTCFEVIEVVKIQYRLVQTAQASQKNKIQKTKTKNRNSEFLNELHQLIPEWWHEQRSIGCHINKDYMFKCLKSHEESKERSLESTKGKPQPLTAKLAMQPSPRPRTSRSFSDPTLQERRPKAADPDSDSDPGGPPRTTGRSSD